MDRARFEENGVWSEMVYFNAQPGSRAWAEVVGRDRQNAPKRWPVRFLLAGIVIRMGRCGRGGVPAPTGKGKPWPLPIWPACRTSICRSASTAEAGVYPFLLVTQGLITQPQGWWGILPTLQESYGLQTNRKWTSWVEVSPRAAESLRVANGDLVWVGIARGQGAGSRPHLRRPVAQRRLPAARPGPPHASSDGAATAPPTSSSAPTSTSCAWEMG